MIDLDFLGKAELLASGKDFIEISGRVPQNLELFQDHFPGFPVLPGVLALAILKKTVETVNLPQAERLGRLRSIRNGKFSSYLRPGQDWKAVLKRRSSADPSACWRGRLFNGDKIAASADLVFENTFS